MSTRQSTLDFLKTEVASGTALAIAALAAVAIANSVWADLYFHWVHAEHTLQIAGFVETKSPLKWIKEGLMAVFFFVVGLEIKYEILRGELSSLKKLGLPEATFGVTDPGADPDGDGHRLCAGRAGHGRAEVAQLPAHLPADIGHC